MTANPANHARARRVTGGDGTRPDTPWRREPDILSVGARRGEDLARRCASADRFRFPGRETFGNLACGPLASGPGVVAFGHAAAGLQIRQRVSALTVPCGEPVEFIAAANPARDPGFPDRGRSEAPAAVGGLDHRIVVDHLEQVLDQAARQADRKHDQAGHVLVAR